MDELNENELDMYVSMTLPGNELEMHWQWNENALEMKWK